MVFFKKYRARKAYTKELKSISTTELELAHQKLRNPYPPSYDELYGDLIESESERLSGSQHSSSRSSVSYSSYAIPGPAIGRSARGGLSSAAAASSNQSSRSASPYLVLQEQGQLQQQRRQGGSSSGGDSYMMTTAMAASAHVNGTVKRSSGIERPAFHLRSEGGVSTRS